MLEENTVVNAGERFAKIKFGLFSASHPSDLEFDCNICWSRVYEYPYALAHTSGTVHNTSWGFEGIHITFKNYLDARYPTVHSDIKPSTLPNTTLWDLTTPPPDEWVNFFDTVLCISTLEHIAGDHVAIIRDNLLPQVAPGGKLVVTFDLPGLQVEAVEEFVDEMLLIPPNPLTPRSSATPDLTLNLPDHYRVGYLTIYKHPYHTGTGTQ